MRDYLSNEIIFNTPVLNKNLYDFISKDSPALRVGSRRIWKTIRIGAYHFCLYACPASKRCQRVRWKTIRTRAYHSWDAKFCDSPPVMRDYLSNEIIFNTPVLNKNLHDFISRDSPALRVGSRRILRLQMVSESQVKNDKNRGLSILPLWVCSLPMVSERQIKNDKSRGLSFLLQ